jgi:glycine cleavage system aminomethyltransferase T
LQEKSYGDYGHDMDNTDTLLECGLGFTCNFDKNEPFIGQEHVIQQKNQAKQDGGLMKRLAGIRLLDPKPLLHHGEVVWRNGERVSDVRSASYGHTVGGAVGLSMLQASEPITNAYINDGYWEVEIAHQKYPCQVSLQPFYDPKSVRVKV